MAPTSMVELPDVSTAGCDEGVEFVFLEGDGDAEVAAEDKAAMALGRGLRVAAQEC